MAWSILEIVSGLAIAAAGLYVVGNALHGRWLEYLAALPGNEGSKETLTARAKAKYLQASLSKRWVLIVLATGIVLQIVVGGRKLYLELAPLMITGP